MSASVSERSSPLLSGIDRARRPTGPLLGLVVVVVCMLVGQLVGGLVLFPLFGVSPAVVLGGRMDLSDQLATMLSFAGVLGLLWLWIRLKERRPFGSVGFFPAARIGTRLGLGALVAVVLLSVPIGVNVLSGQFEAGAFRAAQLGGVALALVGFAVQASTEEVLTRGYLMQVTYRKWGLVAAIASQAVVFTALHGTNLNISAIALLNILLVALLLAFWALAEGGLWGVCAFHAVWNWCQGNVYGVEVSGMDTETTALDVSGTAGSAPLLTGGGFGVEGSILTTAVLAIATAAAILAYRRAVVR